MTDFSKLWELAINMAKSIDNEKLKSILVNGSESKENVCRKLGIVGEVDVNRIMKKFRRRLPRSVKQTESRIDRETR